MKIPLVLALVLCVWAGSSVAAHAPAHPLASLKLAAEGRRGSRYQPADVARAARLTIRPGLDIEPDGRIVVLQPRRDSPDNGGERGDELVRARPQPHTPMTGHGRTRL